MKIETWALSKIKPYKNNPRLNDNAVAAVAESIRQCGYCNPIIVDESGVVLAGHTRLKALRQLGWDKCEVNVITGMTEEQKNKFRLLDNKTGEQAEWDIQKLIDELNLVDFEGYDFGFDLDDEKPEIKEVNLLPYTKVHYLITCDINDNDKVIDLIEQLRQIGGVEVDSTTN